MTIGESSSPRGRLSLMRALTLEKIELGRKFKHEMYFCLGCLACESACPAGVPYRKYLDQARTIIKQRYAPFFSVSHLRDFFLVFFFETRSRINIQRRIISLLKSIRFDVTLRIFSRLIRDRMNQFVFLFRAIDVRVVELDKKESSRSGARRKKVGLLRGCIMDYGFGDVNLATMRLLEKIGFDVVIPKGQACCGSLQSHQGLHSTGNEFAAKMISSFPYKMLNAIIVNAAGCSSFMKSYGDFLHQDSTFDLKELAEFSSKVKDLSEFLDEIGLPYAAVSRNSHLYDRVVTYQDPCHLAHAQGIRHAPRKLLRAIEGIRYVELADADTCCGSAGIYNITHHEASLEILDKKIENIKAINPDVIVTANPGCMIQLKAGLLRHNLSSEVLHIASFLNQVYAN